MRCALRYRTAMFPKPKTMTAQMLPITVKKARVSLRVKRMPFQPLPDGHPAVPSVYAVGRFEHFEYLSMELFGPSMSDTSQPVEVRKRIAPHAIVQRCMLPYCIASVTEVIASEGRLVHPSNFLFASPGLSPRPWPTKESRSRPGLSP